MKSGSETTGIVLAGGKSSRMGFEKGLAEIQGKKMIEWVIQALQPVCQHLIVISNTNVYDYLGIPVYSDIYTDTGPLGGIYTGLKHSITSSNLMLACDMPFISSQVLQQLLLEAAGYEIVVPSIHGQWHPLCAHYNKQINIKVEELITTKVWKMQEAIRRFHFKEWPADKAGFDARFFANINTFAELQQIQK
ncbi:molybdenum cofactor guanylyltransferase [Rhodocytophaga rosea]|uniref:Probable molybdenum cofactor guanylyltransferase n=1 Tax=Rhodocytophaga rosea TaxID=2704465 RepID=A0A6C0GGM2_9BACT|nr:molybdenum cofactor guanylyltransferase [Rhodocytophaga rosea]QHT66933.1 molybdenum cofactor guanylyltransferase [Rhodocytophaga rosea]